LRYDRTTAVLGLAVPPDQQRAILTALGFDVLRQNDLSLTVAVPHRRHDVTREADLIEEIARLHGFDRIPATLPRVRPMRQRVGVGEERLRALRQFLANQGLTEFYSWSFSNPEDLLKAGLAQSHAGMVMLENPLSERHAGMRTTLLPGLLHAAAYNLNRGTEAIAAFEIGPVYSVAENDTRSTQQMHLGILLCGARGPLDWSTKAVETDFYDIKGRAEAVCAYYGLSLQATACTLPLYQPGQAAEFCMEGVRVGHFGKVSHEVEKHFDLNHAVFVLEMNLDILGATPRQHPQFAPIPEFPPAPRDLALLVESHVPAGSLVDTVRRAGGKLLRTVEIFDVFAGGAIPPGRKSIALRLIFQSAERTLTDADTEKALAKVLKLLEQEHGAQLR
jgi:phenylalanyl-tRNA synthetase beta chain